MLFSIVSSGIGIGALYGLLALGYFLFFQATTAINFAIGAIAMFAGMAMAVVSQDMSLPWAIGILVAVALAVLLAWISEAAILRPILARSSDEFGAVVAIVALMFVIEQLAGVIFGRRPIQGRQLFDAVHFVGDGIIESRFLWNTVISVIVFAVVVAWLKHGSYGRMLRAAGDNETAARVLGLPIRRIKFAAVFATGLVCAVAGVLYVSQAPLNFHSHLAFAIAGFIAFVIGGTGSAWAPLVGGILLGLIEAFTIWFLGGGARDYMLLLLVLVVFSVRPEGIFTVRVRT
ncbi:branched-chain amino acid ABC transporter permease [Pollutimonas sp. H1-120]|uniref:branched-chain amino acid ABC transporter permease n=1 Tax=Pollutimonas sp. H1-120 TaxID=3148824 RepID=UPI003B51BB27